MSSQAVIVLGSLLLLEGLLGVCLHIQTRSSAPGTSIPYAYNLLSEDFAKWLERHLPRPRKSAEEYLDDCLERSRKLLDRLPRALWLVLLLAFTAIGLLLVGWQIQRLHLPPTSLLEWVSITSTLLGWLAAVGLAFRALHRDRNRPPWLLLALLLILLPFTVAARVLFLPLLAILLLMLLLLYGQRLMASALAIAGMIALFPYAPFRKLPRHLQFIIPAGILLMTSVGVLLSVVGRPTTR